MIRFKIGRRLLLAGGLTLLSGGVIATSNIAPSLAASPQTAAQGTAQSQSGHHRGGNARAVLRGLARDAVKITAQQTGLTTQQVRADLKQGQSLNQIAGSKAGAVESAVLQDIKTKLDKLVSAGKITADQENKIMARAKTAVDKLMARQFSGQTAGGSQNGQGGTTTN